MLVVADAATPRLVAGDVGVLRLERLVARPRAARTGVADGDTGHTGQPQDQVDRAHALSSSSGRRVEPLAQGGLHERGVGLAAGRLHDLTDEEADGLGLPAR